MIEKLGITKNTPGWEDEAKREMLEVLIALVFDSVKEEYNRIYARLERVGKFDSEIMEYAERLYSGEIKIIERAVGLTWAQVKERI